MKQQDFDELVESIRQAGKIKRGETAGASNPDDASDGRIGWPAGLGRMAW